MTKRQVWAVTSGEYESYGVDCLFESETDAQAAVAAGIGEDVRSYRLYGPGEMPRKALIWCARAEVTTDHVFAKLHRWPPDRTPRLDTRSYEQWTHIDAGEVDLQVNASASRLFGYAYGEERDAVLAAATTWYDEQKRLHPAPPS